MAALTGLDGLDDYIKIRIERIIEKDIKPVLKKMYLKRTRSDIYGSITTPKGNAWSGGKYYERRYDLKDPSGLYYELSYQTLDESTAEFTLFMTHDAFPAPSILKKKYKSKYKHGALLALLQSGNMGLWATPDRTHYFPRPLLSNMQAEVDKSIEIRDAIYKGLKREGLSGG